jgi:hypothetical protein
MTYTAKWDRQGWRPELIILEPTNQRLSSASGLPWLLELFMQSPWYDRLQQALPPRLSNSSYHPLHFALLLIGGFWMGYDCLDDLEKFADDPIIVNMFTEVPTAKSFGNFLRDFSESSIQTLRSLLKAQALEHRLKLSAAPITFNIDSTPHEHHGDKIEGLELNYKGLWCLDSLEVFDELGLCYDFDLRPGATFSATGAVTMMEGLARPFLPDRAFDFARADSAFCNEEYIRMCLLKKFRGTITAHGNIRWLEKVPSIYNWQPWVYRPEEIEKSLRDERPLPRVEVGFYMYEPGWDKNEALKFPVVIKRTFKPYERLSRKQISEMIKNGQNPKQGLWTCYAVLSLMGLYPRTPQQIIEFHNPRGNAENMIKESKIGFDLTHFPCRKMLANHAYALLGMIAYNFLRFIARLQNPEHPHFAKKLRQSLVLIPGRLVTRAYNWYLQVPPLFYKEVQELKRRWAALYKPLRILSSA